MLRICFRLGCLAGLAALLVEGAGLPDALAGGITSVVRTDGSGRLVRVILAAPGANAALAAAVNRIAEEHALPPELIDSVIKAESNYNPSAISPKGAVGIMQLMPETARRFGVSDSLNPVENIRGGAKYLKYLLDLYHGDYPLALAAYNAGEHAVARYGGVPPYKETRNYVDGVGRRLEKSIGAKAKAEEKPAPEPDAAAPRHIQQITEADGSVRYVSK